uniref:Uncharacterized protein n=1 Tax=Globodera pallida TaxID=36090 RepID=A0A183CJR1_GLOPA
MACRHEDNAAKCCYVRWSRLETDCRGGTKVKPEDGWQIEPIRLLKTHTASAIGNHCRIKLLLLKRGSGT